MALFNGVVWGSLLGLLAWWLYGAWTLGLVMTAATTSTCCWPQPWGDHSDGDAALRTRPGARLERVDYRLHRFGRFFIFPAWPLFLL